MGAAGGLRGGERERALLPLLPALLEPFLGAGESAEVLACLEWREEPEEPEEEDEAEEPDEGDDDEDDEDGEV